MELEGVIFDFDGIVIDSEPLHFKAFNDTLEPHNLQFTWAEYEQVFMGMDDRDAFNTVFANNRLELSDALREELIQRKARRFPELIAEQGAPAYEGVVELIRLVADVVPLGLSSGALRMDVEPVLRQLGLFDLFGAIVTADNVARSKPDPESYRLCLKLLGALRPEAWFAIEDTGAGIASAKAAGMRVLAVTNSYPADRLGEADQVVDSLRNVTPEVLTSWL